MTTTQNLFQVWKEKRGFRTDGEAAKALNVRHSAVANWRSGRAHANAPSAAKMAEECGLDPLAVLAAIEADRAHDTPTQRVWARYGKGAFVALVMAVGGLALPVAGHTGGDTSSHYAKRRRGPWQGPKAGWQGVGRRRRRPNQRPGHVVRVYSAGIQVKSATAGGTPAPLIAKMRESAPASCPKLRPA